MTLSPLHPIRLPSSPFALLALLGIAACGGDRDQEGAAVPSVIGAETTVVITGSFTEQVGAIGTVVARAGHVAVLSAPAATRISAVEVSEGDHVVAGEALVVFEQAGFAAAAHRAEAGRATAQQAYDRAERLLAEGIAPRRDLEQASAELARTRADVVAAQREQELSVLRAPITGVVTQLWARLGASADPSQPLVEVVDPSALDVVLTLAPGDAARVHPGAVVVLHAGLGVNGEALGEGTVASVSGIVDSTTRGVAIRVHRGSGGRPLRLGETLFGEIVLATRAQALIIPVLALVPEGDGFKVFVVDSAGIAHARTVTIGGRQAAIAEITAGLTAGERVVTYGAYGVEEGATIAPPGQAATKPPTSTPAR